MWRFIAFLCFSLGCGLAPVASGTAGSTDGVGSSAGSTAGDSVTGNAATTAATTAVTTGGSPGSSGVSGDGDTQPSSTRGLLGRLDGGSPACDFAIQDCPEGQKCVAHSPGPDFLWSTFVCVPVAPDPGGAGAPCTAEYWSSGVDTCDKGSTCWHLNGENIGHCLPNCNWDTGCADPDGYCRLLADSEFAPMLCFTSCHPLVQDCPDGEVCSYDEFWGPPAYSCYPGTGVVGGAVFDDCSGFAFGLCAAGLACVLFLPLPCSGAGCCLPYCDLTAPECPDGLACLPFPNEQPLPPPPGYEDIGVCVFP